MFEMVSETLSNVGLGCPTITSPSLEHIKMFEFLARELIATNVAISIFSLICSIILFIVVFVRSVDMKPRCLWYLASSVFFVGSITRMFMVFVGTYPSLLFWIYILNAVLTLLFFFLTVTAWFNLDEFLKVRREGLSGDGNER